MADFPLKKPWHMHLAKKTPKLKKKKNLKKRGTVHLKQQKAGEPCPGQKYQKSINGDIQMLHASHSSKIQKYTELL